MPFPLDDTETRPNFAYFVPIQTHWSNQDAFGHMNNAHYLACFDTTVMHYLIHEGGFDVKTGPFRTFTVENMCRYHRGIVFPQIIECGLRIIRLGTSSVRYEIGMFIQDEEDVAATGYFIDVFVDAVTERPTEIPAPVRKHLSRLVRE